MRQSFKQKVLVFIVAVFFALPTVLVFGSGRTYGADPAPTADPKTTTEESDEDHPVATCEEEGHDGVCQDPENILGTPGTHQCGKGDKAVKVAFNFGCRGDSYQCPSVASGGTCKLNPITDIGFALFRVLSAGVGLVVIGSIIVAGIQYTTSRGDPQGTQNAIKRITNALIALLIYIFMFAIANFIVPGGMFL